MLPAMDTPDIGSFLETGPRQGRLHELLYSAGILRLSRPYTSLDSAKRLSELPHTF